MKVDTIELFVIAILVVASFLAGRSCGRTPANNNDTTTRVDTVTSYVWHSPITITETKTKLTTRVDTVHHYDTTYIVRNEGGKYCSYPFVARLDTIVDGDTIGVQFKYPEATLSALIKQQPTEIKTLYVTKTVTTTLPTWQVVLTHLGAFAGGYFIGSQVK